MRIAIATIIFLFSVVFPPQKVNAGVVIYSDSNAIVQTPTSPIALLKAMSRKQVQTLLGRKLSLKEKVAYFILKRSKQTKADPIKGEAVRSKKGTWALILGVSSFLILGPLGAIPAIILGAQALKENPNDTNAKIGKVLGIVYLVLMVLALLLLIAIISSLGVR